MRSSDALALVTVSDALQMLSAWVRTERQRRRWTLGELARRSGVPSSTISRLERTGLGSTDAVLKVLFALNRLDAVADFLKERQRLAALPTTLRKPVSEKPVLRVRMRKGTSVAGEGADPTESDLDRLRNEVFSRGERREEFGVSP